MGYGYLTNIPQQDRTVKDGDTVYNSVGYTTKGILTPLVSFKIGYRVINGMSVYGVYCFTKNVQWFGGGVKFEID